MSCASLAEETAAQLLDTEDASPPNHNDPEYRAARAGLRGPGLRAFRLRLDEARRMADEERSVVELGAAIDVEAHRVAGTGIRLPRSLRSLS